MLGIASTVVWWFHEYMKIDCGGNLLVPVKAKKCSRGTWVVVGPLPGILDDYQSTSYEDVEESSFLHFTDNPSDWTGDVKREDQENDLNLFTYDHDQLIVLPR